MKKAAVLFLSLFILLLTDSYGQSLLELIRMDSLTISSHRGVSELGEEENSIQSMSKALSKGILLHEIDVMESKDGKLYLLHDETLDRTTNLSGRINDIHSSLLDRAVLKGTQETLPTFTEALSWAKEHGAYLMLDVKAAPIAKVMAEVEKLGMRDRVMLLTFNRERTKEALAYPNDFLISALIQDNEDIGYFLRLFTDPNSLLGYINKTADSQLYKQVASAGIFIITDTMGDLDANALKDGGESYIHFIDSKRPAILVSDYPLLLKQAVNMHF